ncbi:thymidine phosphorylase [Clostridium sp. OM05-6BH]|jgi:pyrimidine-nucleoside phosphorylase|uniref:thymidine phosphorylase n=1 Tax=unclassified Clostridium TaxID=2614128 RepID=UPI000E4E6413|nr:MULTISPECIES: thymidine phosphorylase [unclassified Clostridium]RHV12235.1 thymidine phosphorylase [Clostridium sp. OM05-9BH]RHV17890.1 thymidine phosphorylase [Clostridium sp. OM05-6BH]
MNVYEIIDKKKRGLELNQTEIEYLINGYVNNEIPDYQISAWLMAVYFQGMTDRELLALTNCMTKSGEIVDLSSIMGVKVDKHSTGGVGDKVTLVVAPIVAACGGKVAKMSGRGLGFTGGTIDKLEAIPGLKTALAEEDFFNMVNEIGLAVMGQSADIAPADKKLYALRDVTATVDSIPLIASSIMSKKLAAGSDKIVLDVTVGSGAFMKDKENAVQLAEKMVAIGNGAGKKTVAILTNMDVPLGKMVGNNLEVVEAIETLKGRGPEDLIAVVVEIASTMLYLAQIGTKEECMKKVKRVIADGSALEKLKLMVERQGGDGSYIENPDQFEKAIYQHEIIANNSGYIGTMNTEECGKAAVLLGAGREVKDDPIDMTAGIKFNKKTGDAVKQGDIVAIAYSSSKEKLQQGVQKISDIYDIVDKRPQVVPEIIGYIE